MHRVISPSRGLGLTAQPRMFHDSDDRRPDWPRLVRFILPVPEILVVNSKPSQRMGRMYTLDLHICVSCAESPIQVPITWAIHIKLIQARGSRYLDYQAKRQHYRRSFTKMVPCAEL